MYTYAGGRLPKSNGFSWRGKSGLSDGKDFQG